MRLRQGPGHPGGRDGPAPPPCQEPQCFDLLVRGCVSCSLLRTPQPKPASPPSDPPLPAPSLPCAPCSPSLSPPPAAGESSQAPWTALQPLGSVGSGAAEPEVALRLPALLFGAPVGLGLALALVLLGLLSWRWRRRPLLSRAASTEARDTQQDELLENIVIVAPGSPEDPAPTSPPPRDDPATTLPAHSVPVPATELGSTELVTTKTAGPEPQ
ncbi:PREDICTED: tumor necrosis factor receptor superfamily member 13C isoform X1 [Condylura cristata]|uniref:tumor necrosis factor receptor superfamily member 13C isoform X1 n=1 Tax=Condylura cristata TaxID=143302 RepID=UPI000643AF0C|nr:PREDICTED: tumor necrosis factor receptor superfamily member 13C isoform X1 [Condylura cristata]